jgi:hypothetical protein
MVELNVIHSSGCDRCQNPEGSSHAASCDHIDYDGKIVDYVGCYVCHSCWISFPAIPQDGIVTPAMMGNMIASELYPGTFWFRWPDLPAGQ